MVVVGELQRKIKGLTNLLANDTFFKSRNK